MVWILCAKTKAKFSLLLKANSRQEGLWLVNPPSIGLEYELFWPITELVTLQVWPSILAFNIETPSFLSQTTSSSVKRSHFGEFYDWSELVNTLRIHILSILNNTKCFKARSLPVSPDPPLQSVTSKCQQTSVVCAKNSTTHAPTSRSIFTTNHTLYVNILKCLNSYWLEVFKYSR